MFSFECPMLRKASSMVSMYLSLSSWDAAAEFDGGPALLVLLPLLVALSFLRELPSPPPPWPWRCCCCDDAIFQPTPLKKRSVLGVVRSRLGRWYREESRRLKDANGVRGEGGRFAVPTE